MDLSRRFPSKFSPCASIRPNAVSSYIYTHHYSYVCQSLDFICKKIIVLHDLCIANKLLPTRKRRFKCDSIVLSSLIYLKRKACSERHCKLVFIQVYTLIHIYIFLFVLVIVMSSSWVLLFADSFILNYLWQIFQSGGRHKQKLRPTKRFGYQHSWYYFYTILFSPIIKISMRWLPFTQFSFIADVIQPVTA